jgi:hypothetical protein
MVLKLTREEAHALRELLEEQCTSEVLAALLDKVQAALKRSQ